MFGETYTGLHAFLLTGIIRDLLVTCYRRNDDNQEVCDRMELRFGNKASKQGILKDLCYLLDLVAAHVCPLLCGRYVELGVTHIINSRALRSRYRRWHSWIIRDGSDVAPSPAIFFLSSMRRAEENKYCRSANPWIT